MSSHAWCTPELVKAVEKGYTLVKIHEVWHFPEDQRRTGLFADYVNTWLKLKKNRLGGLVGVKPWNKSESTFFTTERGGDPTGYQPDCQLSRTQGHGQVNAQHVPDPFFLFSCCHPTSSHGFFCFCSFWGKFGERINKPTTVTVKDPSHLFSLLSNAALDISTLRLCSDHILEAVYTSVNDNAIKGTKTNIFVAAFTTCHARLKIYEFLDVLQEQVLNYDTDSVVYKWRPDQPSIATCGFLGDMTDELDGDVITEFVSGGAKNNGYTTREGKKVCKTPRIHPECSRRSCPEFSDHER